MGKEKRVTSPPRPPTTAKKPRPEATAERKLMDRAFRSCAALLQRLMEHEYGWLFNAPVDVRALRLPDYYAVIRHPMDLGTVRSRLDKRRYACPSEFAADVRLTFRNAMTYNAAGDPAYAMAEELSRIFEARWPAIEAGLPYLSIPAVKKHPPPTQPPLQPVARARDMTTEEMRRLCDSLQRMPPEGLESIVQIISKRNSCFSKLNHTVKVDLDLEGMEAETLWELDRLVSNYKKNGGQNRRKAEQNDGETLLQGRVPNPVVKASEEMNQLDDARSLPSSSLVGGETKADDTSRLRDVVCCDD